LRLFTGFVLVSFLGCSSNPNGDSWIIRTSSQCITVSELGAEWDNLDSAAVAGFLSEGNPVGDFITTYSRKLLVVDEVSNSDYLFSRDIQSYRDSYARNAAYAAFCDSVNNYYLNSISREDVASFSHLLGKTVWFSESPGTARGPVDLQYLNWDLAVAFDSMSSGDTLRINGVLYTLDSAFTAADSLIEPIMADPEFFESYATSRIAHQRLSADITYICQETVLTFQADSAVVSELLHHPDSMEDSTVVASWSTGCFTVADFPGMMSFSAVSGSVAPYTIDWIVLNLKNHAMMDEIESLYSSSNCSSFSQIQDTAETLAMKRAGDLLYEDRVLSHITVTDSMLIASYESMDSLPIVPESRIFEAVVVPVNDLDRASEFVGGSLDPEFLGFRGFSAYLDQGEYLSRPVTASEVPGDMGTILFMLDEDNREWQRPVEVEEGLFIMFRLDSIIQEHPAEFHQMEPVLRENVQAHLEEQVTMEWLRELEEIHHLEINTDILEDLPADLSCWSTL